MQQVLQAAGPQLGKLVPGLERSHFSIGLVRHSTGMSICMPA